MQAMSNFGLASGVPAARFGAKSPAFLLVRALWRGKRRFWGGRVRAGGEAP